MSLITRTFVYLIAGALAGLLSWIITEPSPWFSRVINSAQVQAGDPVYLAYGGLFGCMLGLLFAIADTMASPVDRRTWKVMMLGCGVGFLGGVAGLFFGQSLYAVLVPTESAQRSPLGFIGRCIGWALIGTVTGATSGISRRSVQLAKQGAFGGALGGALGGCAYQAVAMAFATIPHVAVVARLAAFVATGALAGFFVGLVQDVLKRAWIRVVLGRNEGSEYLLAKPVTTIGRSEEADIPLYGDPQVAHIHAAIEALPSQNRHRLRHVARAGSSRSHYPTLLNGQEVSNEQWIVDGDTIDIGKRRLVFHEKATRGQSAARSATAGRPSGPVPPAPSMAIPMDVLEQASAQPVGTFAPSQPQAAPMQSTSPRLLCQRGPYTGQSFPLTHGVSTIGRATTCDIALVADRSISRGHAEIRFIDRQHWIVDAGSANGVTINGVRVQGEQALQFGDVIQLGETVFQYA